MWHAYPNWDLWKTAWPPQVKKPYYVVGDEVEFEGKALGVWHKATAVCTKVEGNVYTFTKQDGTWGTMTEEFLPTYTKLIGRFSLENK